MRRAFAGGESPRQDDAFWNNPAILTQVSRENSETKIQKWPDGKTFPEAVGETAVQHELSSAEPEPTNEAPDNL